MKKRQSNLTIFAILTTITILTWVFAEGYQRFYKAEIIPVPIKLLSPFTPTLDLATLKELENKKFISGQDPILTNIPKSQGTQNPLPIPKNEESTQSAQPVSEATVSAGPAQ